MAVEREKLAKILKYLNHNIIRGWNADILGTFKYYIQCN